jgi:hypothetical protein
VVQYGRRLRDAALVAKVRGTLIGATLDAYAITAGQIYRYLQLATAHEYEEARQLVIEETGQ